MEKEYFLNGRKIRSIIHKFSINNIEYVVADDGNDWIVSRMSELKPFEETWQYKREKEEQKNLDKIKLEREIIVKKIKEEAVKSLETTLRLNSAFSEDGKMSQIGIHFACKLKELIDNKLI